MAASRLRVAMSAGFGAVMGIVAVEALRHRGNKVVYRVSAALPHGVLQGPKHEEIISGPIRNTSDQSSCVKRLGWPQSSVLRHCKDFTISYNTRTRVPEWAIERLTRNGPESTEVPAKSSQCHFRQDTTINPMFRSTNSDYKGSGFDRGHIVPAANHCRCREEMQETFSLINVAPQVGEGFNNGIWNRLEKYTRDLVEKFETVYICTGTLFLPKSEGGGRHVKYAVIGENDVGVPTHFFKVAAVETESGEIACESYIMPNEAIDKSKSFDDFKVKVEDVERASGLEIFANIKDQHTTYKNVASRSIHQ